MGVSAQELGRPGRGQLGKRRNGLKEEAKKAWRRELVGKSNWMKRALLKKLEGWKMGRRGL